MGARGNWYRYTVSCSQFVLCTVGLGGAGAFLGEAAAASPPAAAVSVTPLSFAPSVGDVADPAFTVSVAVMLPMDDPPFDTIPTRLLWV